MRPYWHRTARLTISLPVELAEALKETVASRRFASVSEVIREALRDWLISATRGRPLQLRNPARPPALPTSDITDYQLAGLRLMADVRGLLRFAVRGSARKRDVDCAAVFGTNLPFGATPQDALRDLQSYLSFRWDRGVFLIPFDEVDDWAQWTIVFDADAQPARVPGSETESSSTS